MSYKILSVDRTMSASRIETITSTPESNSTDPKPKIYLAGPITGCNPSDIHSWRRLVTEQLSSSFELLDPAEDVYIAARLSAGGESFPTDQSSSFGRSAYNRNRQLIAHSDLVLANVLGANCISVGVVGEVFTARELGVPIVLVREKFGNPHDHLLLNAVITWTMHTIEDAVNAIRKQFYAE